jgi:hypothetical protein
MQGTTPLIICEHVDARKEPMKVNEITANMAFRALNTVKSRTCAKKTCQASQLHFSLIPIHKRDKPTDKSPVANR